MTNATFSSLIDRAKFHNGNGIENFGFSSKLNNNELSFYVNGSDKVIVEDFGFMKSGKWFQEIPTGEQIEIMQNMINQKLENFPKEEEEIFQDFDGDYYAEYGVTRAMFY